MKKRFSTSWSLMGLAWTPLVLLVAPYLGPRSWWMGVVVGLLWLVVLLWLIKKSGGFDAV